MLDAMSNNSPRIRLRPPRPLWIALAAVLLIVASIGIRFILPIYRQEAAKRFLRKRDIPFETAYHGPSWLSPERLGNWCKPGREWFEDIVEIDPDTFGMHSILGGKTSADVTDSDLELFKSLKELTALSIAGRGITDAGLFHLRFLDKLETLSITDAAITDAGLVHLKGLGRLKTLSLSRTNVTESGLPHLQEMIMLESLDLPDMELTDAGGVQLWKLISQSKLQNISLPVKSSKSKSRDPALTLRFGQLNLSNTQISDAGLRGLDGIPDLTALHLSGTPITDAGLRVVGRLPGLTRLDLSNSKITGAGLEHLHAIKSLEWLDLSHTDLSDDDLAHLPHVSFELKLSGTQITDARLSHENEPARLDLSNTQIGDNGMTTLSTMPRLSEIDLEGTRITDSGLRLLMKKSHLNWINIRNTQVTFDMLVELQKVFPHLSVN